MSEKSVSSLKSVEEEYADFIKERIQKSGGSIQFQHLTGHLSQLDFRVREALGTSKSELMKFIRKHKNLFSIDEHGIVTVNSSIISVQKEKSKNGSYDSSSESGGSLPFNINDGEGIVVRIFPTYGFINAQKPFKTSVYFTPANFNDKEKTLLTDFNGLFIGRKVCFNAIKGNMNYESKYRATSVWFAPVSDDEEKPTIPNTRKKRETGLYDGNFLDGFGEIQKIFPSVGFIIIDGDIKNTVFFHRHNVCKFKNVMDLTKVLKEGDVVNFKAIRSTKKEARARWEATQVWLKKERSTKLKNGDLDSDLDDTLDVESRKSSTQNRSLKKENGDVKKDKATPQMIKNTAGKISPNNKGTVITFGKNLEELVDADSSLFYVHGNQVTDVCWEFSDGQDVYFDAVEIKSAPYWKAVLVWVGEKPDVVLPTCIGDFSAFIDDDDDLDDIPESGSCTSKTSEISVLSEVSIDSSSKKSEDFKQNQRSSSYDNRQKLADKSFSSEILKSSTHSSQRLSSNANYAPFRKSKDLKQKYSLAGSGEKKKYSYAPHSDNEISNYRKSFDSAASLNKSDLIQDELPPTGSEENVENFKKFSFCDSSTLDHSETLNWGDTPYPDDENSENLDTEVFEDCNHSVSDSNNFNKENKQKEIPETKKDLLSVGNKFIKVFEAKADAHNLEENYANIVVESDLMNEPVASESEKKASIKRFQDIDGKITKVYHRYAEMENSLLKKPAAFFWNELYRNGVSVLDHFDDLREVIKIGDIVKFDCFEIVDDFGDFCQKVTVVWSGPKPKIELMTPEQYIKQNNMSVTIVEAKADEKQDEVISESIRLLNKESEAPQKFLSVVYSDEVSSDTEQSVSIHSEMNSLKEQASLYLYQENAVYKSRYVSEPKELNYDVASSSTSNRKQLIETVCEMMEHKSLFSAYSKVCLSYFFYFITVWIFVFEVFHVILVNHSSKMH
ncbi:uncharacterized protein LOC118200716 [Stegodyphus dumicola]|uniref:uncharacterized protein LOC118200716 n=1 Tax=Stegodyphus dumicola TaxID=202533 RepID=UPI0015AC4598|nr:uncharacterized protein LOC118200716 [Stegodyphus dumicola]